MRLSTRPAPARLLSFNMVTQKSSHYMNYEDYSHVHQSGNSASHLWLSKGHDLGPGEERWAKLPLRTIRTPRHGSLRGSISSNPSCTHRAKDPPNLSLVESSDLKKVAPQL